MVIVSATAKDFHHRDTEDTEKILFSVFSVPLW